MQFGMSPIIQHQHDTKKEIAFIMAHTLTGVLMQGFSMIKPTIILAI